MQLHSIDRHQQISNLNQSRRLGWTISTEKTLNDTRLSIKLQSNRPRIKSDCLFFIVGQKWTAASFVGCAIKLKIQSFLPGAASCAFFSPSLSGRKLPLPSLVCWPFYLSIAGLSLLATDEKGMGIGPLVKRDMHTPPKDSCVGPRWWTCMLLVFIVLYYSIRFYDTQLSRYFIHTSLPFPFLARTHPGVPDTLVALLFDCNYHWARSTTEDSYIFGWTDAISSKTFAMLGHSPMPPRNAD